MADLYGVIPDNPISLNGALDLIRVLKSQITSLQAKVKELEIENARLSGSSVCAYNEDMLPFHRRLVHTQLCSKVNSAGCGAVEGNDQLHTDEDTSSLSLKQEGTPCTIDKINVSNTSSKDRVASNKGETDFSSLITGGVDTEEDVHQHDEVGTSYDSQNAMKHKMNQSEEAVSGRCSRPMCKSTRFVALKIMYFGQRFFGFASEATRSPTIESEIFKALHRTKLLIGEKNERSYSRCGRTDKGVSAVGQVIAIYLRSNLKDSKQHENGEAEIDYVKVLNKVLPHDIRVLGWSHAPTNFHARFYDNELWAIQIKGTAFLWHQVRCIVAVLFMIGQGLESPSVIDALLDIRETPRKPQYAMASELPLVLQCCDFEDLNFVCSRSARQALVEQLRDMFLAHLLQAAIFQEALTTLSIPDVSGIPAKRNLGTHIPLKSRPTEPSYEERQAKLRMKDNFRKLFTLSSS
ncbi:uncharacterized protein LOC116261108 isoform X3 [Nymphaea colorata]|uniref:uncharacterized protein LOC116261108 isoform X3 n=1 Tax=Nymphaea colorata TaxID=210225 RepID=UPI00129D445F|nr:uncharacterized protein LOC116261108 isoform X3 [Nymphaea colorata]